jgi:hypothetical protein
MFGNGIAYCQHACVESRFDIAQPSFQRLLLCRIARAGELDAFSDFAKDERTLKDVVIGY